VNHDRQLRTAWQASGMTLADLKRRSKLRVSIVSLSRKLAGKQRMTNDEVAALALALGQSVTVRETVVIVGGKAA
jgi:hypothetical protein